MKTRKIQHLLSALLLAPLLATNPAHAGATEPNKTALGGTVGCAGNHFNRLNGAEAHRSVYLLRNYSESTGINIDRIRVFNASGVNLYDSTADGFPTFINGVLGPSDRVLEPHQTAQLGLADILGNTLPGNERPVQAIFDWSATTGKVLLPHIGHVLLIRDRDIATGALGGELARQSGGCRAIFIRRR